MDSGGLGHPGRAQEKSFWRWESDSHVGEYVGVRAQVQEVEFHSGKNSKSGGAPTVVGAAGRRHSVAVLDAPVMGVAEVRGGVDITH